MDILLIPARTFTGIYDVWFRDKRVAVARKLQGGKYKLMPYAQYFYDTKEALYESVPTYTGTIDEIEEYVINKISSTKEDFM